MSKLELIMVFLGIVFTMTGIIVLCILLVPNESGLAIGTMLSIGIIFLWASLRERLNHVCDICGKK